MKTSFRIIHVLLVLSFCSIVFAQSGYISSFSVTDYELGLGLMEMFTPKTIYVNSDRSLMILGDASFFDDVSWTFMPAIIKLDSQGNLIWYEPIWSTYGSCSNIIGIEIDQNDVVHFVVGRPNSYHVGSIDTNGSHSLHGHKSFVSDGSSRFNHALRLTNGEIMICGKVTAQSYGNYGALFRMSAIGDSLAATYYPPDVQGYEANNCVKLVQIDEHSVYVASYLNSDGLSILQTDMDGSILNRYDIGDSYQYHGTNMFLDSDSLAVFTIDFNNGDYSTSLTSIDISGNIRVYSLGSNMSHILAASKASDGFVLLGMNIQGGFRISKFDQFISNIWSVSYSGITTYESFPFSKEKIQIDQYGCIYFAGSEIGGSEYFNSAVAYKLLPNGQVPVADEVQTPPVNAISAYPNPMKDHLNIKITQDDKPVIAANHIDIFNIKGQLIRSLKLTKGETVWDGKDSEGKPCPKGIYLLRYQYGTSHVTKICKTH
ncbi:MAG: T9SS type A sorting domain-containing protein [Candidatus Cloacimonadaceae bacterium]|jgi:hypothetical protein|nr:T9SS type A sorting domain-containing protein [Candidatus Cloacimonadota bacterium]MDY0127942.1 T9SS type A sorting domain-containing protein [Candidatus Cloacimonadaceae bacterium]